MHQRLASCLAIVIGLLTLTVWSGPADPGQDPPGGGGDRQAGVSVVEEPEIRVLLRDVVGTYDQHEQVIRELYAFLARNGIPPRGNVLGVYLDDPGEVAEDELRWRIGMPIGAEAFQVALPYRIERLPQTQAVVYHTTLAGLDQAGVAAQEWMSENDYVADAAVRMEYIGMNNPDPAQMRVRVVIPVVKADEDQPVEMTLEAVSFLVGEWRAEADDSVLLERWSEPIGDSMLGAFQWVRGGSDVWMYELMTVQQREEEVIFQLRHFDRDLVPWEEKEAPLRFRLAEATANRAVFENMDPEVGPARMTFHRPEPDVLTVQISPREVGEDADVFTFKRVTR